MTNWRDYGTIRKLDIQNTIDNPLCIPGFGEDVQRTLDTMLERDDPPGMRATLDRLLGLGLREDYARYLVSCVIAAEVVQTAETGTTEGWDRFTSRLSTLPETPWLAADH